MNIARDIVDAVMNNDVVAVQQFIDRNQIQAHDCLVLRTAVYCNNLEITQMVVKHSDIFAWNANAVYLSIEDNLKDIFAILFPYICAKNDTLQNFEFLLQAVAVDNAYIVEQLASYSDLSNQSIIGLISRLNQNPQQRIAQSLMNNMSSSQRLSLAENFTLSADTKRLQAIVDCLDFNEIQILHDMVLSFNQGTHLSEKGQHCLDIIDQHRQKCVLVDTVGIAGSAAKKKI